MVKVSGRFIHRVCALVIGALAAQISGAVSAAMPAGLTACGTAIITDAPDGETLTTSDGSSIQLAGIKAPEIWPRGAQYATWPHAEWSQASLQRLTIGQTVSLFCEGETVSLNGEKIAHMQLPSGEWLQQILVGEGAVFVFPRRDHISGIPLLYAAEDRARQSNLGIWQSNKIYRTNSGNDNDVTASSNAAGEIRTGWFQVVRGTVLNAAPVRRQIFLNFGTDWRKDFTVEISASANRAFGKANIDPLSYQMQLVEVRGWVTWKGGPHIMLEGPGQIRTIKQ